MLPSYYVFWSVAAAILICVVYDLLSNWLGPNASNVMLLFVVSLAMALLVSIALEAHNKIASVEENVTGVIQGMVQGLKEFAAKRRRSKD